MSNKVYTTVSLLKVIFPLKDHPTPTYDEKVRAKCEDEPVANTVVTTHFNPTFNLTIKAYRAKYGPYLYWYVGCDIEPEIKLLDIHPFRHICKKDEFGEYDELTYGVNPRVSFWGIVADNDVTRTILKHLCMTDDELRTKCGRTHPTQYRANLIKSLDELWD